MRYFTSSYEIWGFSVTQQCSVPLTALLSLDHQAHLTTSQVAITEYIKGSLTPSPTPSPKERREENLLLGCPQEKHNVILSCCCCC